MSDFNEWWECEGSGLRCEWWEDVEEFAKRVAGIAWVNGAAAEREACKVDNAKLREAIKRYKSEYDNPAPDYTLRPRYRAQMFALLETER